MPVYRPRPVSFGPFKRKCARLGMRFSGYGTLGRLATRIATWAAPYQYVEGYFLAHQSPRGYIAPSAAICHEELTLGEKVFIGQNVLIFQRQGGGGVFLADKARIYRDTILETGQGGSITLGERVNIHARCQLNAYVTSIEIGARAGLAPNCSIYSYDHGFEAGTLIHDQGLKSKGPIRIGADAWLGVGVTVLSGVTIGEGAVIGAGSVVTRDIPAGAIACGVPARVTGMRSGADALHPEAVSGTSSLG